MTWTKLNSYALPCSTVLHLLLCFSQLYYKPEGLLRQLKKPVCLPPLDPDPDTNGKPADHLIVVMRPVNALNNQPLPQSGMSKFHSWIQEQNWKEVLEEDSVDKKGEVLHNMIYNELEEVCPEKTQKISSGDRPWFTEQLKGIKRKKARLFRKKQKFK